MLKSRIVLVIVLIGAACGALILNGCSSSSSTTQKFTIVGAGQ